MFITQEYVQTIYKRPSKSGQVHTYVRKKTILVFVCDNCGTQFKRDKGTMRMSRFIRNIFTFFHCGFSTRVVWCMINPLIIKKSGTPIEPFPNKIFPTSPSFNKPFMWKKHTSIAATARRSWMMSSLGFMESICNILPSNNTHKSDLLN